jgi:hypothetical protein
MTNRVQWTETVSCAGFGRMGKITFSGPSGGDGQDRVERGMPGFITEPADKGFQFRCVDCGRLASLTGSD